MNMLQCRQKCVFTQIFFAQAEMLPVPANISENQLSETLLDSLSSSLGLTAADFTVNTGEVVENCYQNCLRHCWTLRHCRLLLSSKHLTTLQSKYM